MSLYSDYEFRCSCDFRMKVPGDSRFGEPPSMLCPDCKKKGIEKRLYPVGQEDSKDSPTA